MPFVVTWADLESSILSESQREKDMYHIISLIFEILKYGTNTLI